MFTDIGNAAHAGRILWKKHALERMMERGISRTQVKQAILRATHCMDNMIAGISRTQVKQAILRGSIIEYYPDDYPISSVLLATAEPEPLHAVVAYDAASQLCHVITGYRPDLTHFETDLITRRLL